MAEQFAVTQIPGAETGEIPPSPVDRDEKTAFIYSLVDPIWDIDTLPLTYTNSRWSAFFYRADQKQLRRVIPDCLELEDDIVEFWYVDHNHTMLGPYGEMGVTVSASCKGQDGNTYYAGYYPYMYLTQDAAVFAGREPFDDRHHERGPGAAALAFLHVRELSRDVARATAA